MDKIEELLENEAARLRADPWKYASLAPEPDSTSRHSGGLRLGGVVSLATCAVIVTFSWFAIRTDHNQPAENEIAYAELEELAADTVAWAERFAERTRSERRSELQILKRLENDRQTLRRLFGRGDDFGRPAEGSSP